MLVGLLALPPGVNVLLAVALAVVIAIEIFLLVMEIKLIIEELKLVTKTRTEEDTRCKCEINPSDPSCQQCEKRPYPHNPSRAVPQITVYDRRVDVHHTCADGSGNSYGGMDVLLISPREGSISVDLFSEPLQLACEVKTSFKNSEYAPYILSRWLNNTITQVQLNRP